MNQPTYLSQFRLGGTDRLRGYLENRFRGRMFYLQQTELRYPIWRMISFAGFLEFGEATSTNFAIPARSQGIGLRIGLPPNFVTQLRLDLAFAKDQRGVFFDFGHAF
jgi:outer membrane protein assembly factor BamA